VSIQWPDSIDEIFDGDRVVALAYVTPARGVVITPVTNFGVRDRAAGTVTVNSSIGAWKKLERIRRDPHIALAFHTREHADHHRPEYILLQGEALLSPPVPDYPGSILENWERVERWSAVGPLWRRWLRVYAWRVAIELHVERATVWPDVACRGEPDLHGTPPPAAVEPQRRPTRGTAPRMDAARAARRLARLPNVLLGWAGSDGLPVIVPVEVAGTDARGIVLDPPDGLVPPGGRRAGLTGHWFSRQLTGQRLRKHTGWLEAEAEAKRVVYAPHTDAGYTLPPSTLAFRLAAGGATRYGLRGARRAGLVPG
jgi:hypothetical protein